MSADRYEDENGPSGPSEEMLVAIYDGLRWAYMSHEPITVHADGSVTFAGMHYQGSFTAVGFDQIVSSAMKDVARDAARRVG